MDRFSDGISPMLQFLEEHIIEQGLADMHDNAEMITQDSEKYIEQLLELYHRFSDLVSNAFNDDPRFFTSRDKVIGSPQMHYSVVECVYFIRILFALFYF